MVKIRLKCAGARNALCYRIVVMDQRSSRDGKAIEELGFYDPRSKAEKMNLERYAYWTGVGADASATVQSIAKRVEAGVSLKDKARVAKPSKKARAAAQAAAEAKAAEAAAATEEAQA